MIGKKTMREDTMEKEMLCYVAGKTMGRAAHPPVPAGGLARRALSWLLASALLLALGLCLVLAGAALAAPRTGTSPAERSAVEQGMRAADALLKQGRPEEAYGMYAALLRADPDHNGLLLGLARSAMLSGRYAEGLQAYEKLLARFPNDLALLRESKTAYALAGDTEKASRPATVSLLDGDTLPRPEAMRAGPGDGGRLQARGRLSMGITYDSNANQGPANRRLYLGDFPYPVDIGASGKRQETMAGYAAMTLDTGYRLNDAGNWWWVTGADFYLRGNTNSRLDDLGSREWQWGKVDSGIRYVDERNFLDLRVKGDVFDYELDSHAWSFGPVLNYARIVTPDVHLISQVGLDLRDYNKSNDRDGTYLSAGEYLRFFFGEAGHSLTLGGRYRGGFTERNDYAYNGWETSASLNLRLPLGFELSPFVGYGRDYYNGPATALESEKREDERFSVGSGLTYFINESWSVDVSYQYVNNNSESSFYDYDQHVVSCGVSYYF